ncbi:MAG: hypothetical protein U0232_31270 [Thermomicrobiales bacterium]
MSWRRVAAPAVRFKGVKGGGRGTISAPGGMNVPVAFAVDADYERRQWIIWFQGLDDDDGPGEEEVRLPWNEADPWAFEAWCHEGRLKIFFKQFDQQGDIEGPRHREMGVYDTGYVYVP